MPGVVLYENNENLSLAAAAAELGVNRVSLHQWKKEFGTGKKIRMIEAQAQAEAASDAESTRALEKKTQNCAKNEIFGARLRNILPTRHTGRTAYEFVEDHTTEYSFKRMCTVLKLICSSFYKWKATQARRAWRTCEDGLLGARIATVFDEQDGLCGANVSLLYSTKMITSCGSIIKGARGL